VDILASHLPCSALYTSTSHAGFAWSERTQNRVLEFCPHKGKSAQHNASLPSVARSSPIPTVSVFKRHPSLGNSVGACIGRAQPNASLPRFARASLHPTVSAFKTKRHRCQLRHRPSCSLLVHKVRRVAPGVRYPKTSAGRQPNSLHMNSKGPKTTERSHLDAFSMCMLMNH